MLHDFTQDKSKASVPRGLHAGRGGERQVGNTAVQAVPVVED